MRCSTAGTPLTAATGLTLLVLTALPATATTWIVNPDGSGDATTLQGGIDLASPGDTVEVAPGIYDESPLVTTEEIVILAAPGRADVQVGQVFRFEGPLYETVVLVGFELAGGTDARDAVVRLENCEIGGLLKVREWGFTRVVGGGAAGLPQVALVSGSYCTVTFEGCRLEGNNLVCHLEGWASSVNFTECDLIDNGEVVTSMWSWNPQYDGNHGGSFTGSTIEGNGLVLRADWVFSGPSAQPGSRPGPRPRSSGFTMSDCGVRGNGQVVSIGINGLSAQASRFEDNGSLGGGSGCGLSFFDCVIVDNGGGLSASATAEGGSHIQLNRCTYVGNGGGIHVSGDDLAPSVMHLTKTILAGTTSGIIVPESGIGATVFVSCCDVWGNANGDEIPPSSDQGGNFSADPLFCDAVAGNYGLQENSPCAPGASACGLVGALPVSCGSISVEPTSWAGLKALYR